MRKQILGYEDLYEITEHGDVYSLSRISRQNRFLPERLMKLSKSEKGYLKVNLRKDGVMKRFRVHRLVALHFIENPKNFSEVNHYDGNKENNAVSNLEWVDRVGNVQHAIHILKKKFGKRKEPV